VIRAAAIALLVLAAALAGAAEPWEGLWAANPAWCDGGGEGVPVRITAGTFEGLENRCEIAGVSALGIGRSWRLDMLCTAEGMTDRASELFLLAEDGALIRYTEDGMAIRMTRCE
jgi:hypothetical protein